MSELARRQSTLAIAPEQEKFSGPQIEALKNMNGWRDVPDAELSVFFHQAKRTGLDPFARQIYLIGRGGKYTIQTSIDGMRLVADKTGRYAGSDRPVFGEEDGEKYVEVTVYKLVGNPAIRVAFTAVAYESEYAQSTPIWKKMPKTMLAKCCEMLALRKAFPADLSGVYGSEEMDQADVRVEASASRQTHRPDSPATGTRVARTVDAEVVELRHPADEHQEALEEIADLLKNAPEGFFGDPVKIRSYAEESFDKARVSLQRMKRMLDEGKPSEGVQGPQESATTSPEEFTDEDEALMDKFIAEENAGGEPEKVNPGSLPARRSQVELLRTLAVDAAGPDGAEKLEKSIGKAFSDLSRDEADEWIEKLTPGSPATEDES